MKNSAKLFGIITTLALIGLMAACTYDNPDPPETIEWDELREVFTDGRLTITGLSDYEGQNINGSIYIGSSLYLVACEQFLLGYFEGELVRYCETTDSMVIDGQATLKLFKNNIDSDLFENYNGNDKNVKFYFHMWNNGDIRSTIGLVTVDFTDGVGGGNFVLVATNED